MIGIRKLILKNRSMSVLTLAEYENLLDRQIPILSDTCVQIGEFVYPVTDKLVDGTVGITADEFIIHWNNPTTDEEKAMYSAKGVIDLSSDKVRNMQDHIRAIDKLRNMEAARLSTINNVLELPINEEDTTELKLIKQAINAKGIDAESYKLKFPKESDYNNDMRELKSATSHNVSFFKAKRILNAFDIDMSISIKDKPNVINPMNKEFNAKLTTDDEVDV